jgi:hypothetical protein
MKRRFGARLRAFGRVLRRVAPGWARVISVVSPCPPLCYRAWSGAGFRGKGAFWTTRGFTLLERGRRADEGHAVAESARPRACVPPIARGLRPWLREDGSPTLEARSRKREHAACYNRRHGLRPPAFFPGWVRFGKTVFPPVAFLVPPGQRPGPWARTADAHVGPPQYSQNMVGDRSGKRLAAIRWLRGMCM